MTSAAMAIDDVERLQARLTALEQERKHLLAVIEILQDIGGSLHFADVVQSVALRLGETFGLDRCSIFLAERGGGSVRLVASYEDPGIRNYVVDLDRYPELRRALADRRDGVHRRRGHRSVAGHRRAGHWRHARSRPSPSSRSRGGAAPIGAIFLRTFRDGPSFSAADLQFCQVVANLTAKALRNAHRFERLRKRKGEDEDARRREQEQAALHRVHAPAAGAVPGCRRATSRAWATASIARDRAAGRRGAGRPQPGVHRAVTGGAAAAGRTAARADRPGQPRLLRRSTRPRSRTPSTTGSSASCRRSRRRTPSCAPPTAPRSASARRIASALAKVTHRRPMISLGNAFTAEELAAWEERNARHPARGAHGRLHRRDQDRRRRGEPHLRGRAAHGGRHPRQRRHRRGHHRQPAHDRRRPARAQGQGMARP